METNRNQSSIERQTRNFRRPTLCHQKSILLLPSGKDLDHFPVRPKTTSTVYSGFRLEHLRVSFQAARSLSGARSLEIDTMFNCAFII